MAVPKGDGSVRLCEDYRRTVNPGLEIDQYPVPHPEDLMATLTGGHKFSKLDLSAAYQQMILVEDSQPYMVINTDELHPLYVLLKDGTRWHWSSEYAQIFNDIKTLLVQAPVLIHYNPKLPIRLADASNYGIGAVLSHVDLTGQEYLIAFSSHTLSTSE